MAASEKEKLSDEEVIAQVSYVPIEWQAAFASLLKTVR